MTRINVLVPLLLVAATSAARPSAWQTSADLESRRAAIEQRLGRIAGHESTKASVRYPYDLVRLVALGRRPLPGPADHFDLEKEFARSEELLRSLEAGRDLLWRATGDHARHHDFTAGDEIMPYRIYVPTKWNGRSPLPLVLMLHGGGATENTNMDNDASTLPRLAEQRGYIVVCPLGYRPNGAFGNRSGMFGQTAAASARDPVSLASGVARERVLDLSEQDTMQVLDLVVAEYGVDPRRIYLAGHSMGSGGAWHLAAKYPERWAAVAPMSGPLVDEREYPFERLRGLPILITEGTKSTGTLEASLALLEYVRERRLDVKYLEVDATHLGMVPLVLPSIFDFFDKQPKRRALTSDE